MKVFLSWSGELSRRVALVFREWLPSVIQAVEPYVSSEDIDKGARWSSDIAQELEVSSYGIICITKENIEAPWINFEAGALAKTFDKAYVSPFLFGIKRFEVSGPLLQFQSTLYEKDDVKKLIDGINKACDLQGLDSLRLDKVFEMWWPALKEELDNLLVNSDDYLISDEKENSGEINSMLEEVLELTRNQQKLLRSPHDILPPEYLAKVIGELSPSTVHPGAIADLRRGLTIGEALIKKYEETREMDINEFQHMLRMLRRPLVHLTKRTKHIEQRIQLELDM
ncbi:TIR domain-containing protein [Aneurinibacillus soli]|uniref:Uncharacterized protein n=1 Tax=Aneurinibacillus soli TaxID=1500254 RepID=A0A0U5AWU3_9BACL|nr:TIR domain-containing protein [Aneurinibacillus soli]PYE64264.1 TIR domain-containing protein [Aneurinibacillus soli]BAU28213.1 hypothetical protein CB4_02387 [Aneurinibacillus soli]